MAGRAPGRCTENNNLMSPTTCCARRGSPAAPASAHLAVRRGGPDATSLAPRGGVGSVFWRDAQADVPSARRLRAQLAFKNSMVRGILQFTPGIAFCYVLHRCESRDIRCRESFCIFCDKRTTSLKHRHRERCGDRRRAPSFVSIPWRDSRRGFVRFASKRLIPASHPTRRAKGRRDWPLRDTGVARGEDAPAPPPVLFATRSRVVLLGRFRQ